MRNTSSKVIATAFLALLLTACGNADDGDRETEKTDSNADNTSTSAVASSAAEENEPSHLGEAQEYAGLESEQMALSVVVESAEKISPEQCTTTWFQGVPEGKELVKISISAEMGNAPELDDLGLPLDFSPASWGWVTSDGYKSGYSWNQDCIDSSEQPAMQLNKGEKTRGDIILEVKEGDFNGGAPYYEPSWGPFAMTWKK